MRRLFLVIVDTVLLVAAALTATAIRFGSESSDVLFNQRGWMKLIMLTGVIQLAFYLFDLYDLPATRRYRRVIINLVIALSVATVLLSILFYVVARFAVRPRGIPGRRDADPCGHSRVEARRRLERRPSTTRRARAGVDTGLGRSGY